ncbi:MAG TPA: PIG-L family deacetylase, partial [Longimicrobiales bacterium]|nr:PIG-L family deacetylase [Longimicrobiales bacterium]
MRKLIFALLLLCSVSNAFAQTQTDEYRGVIASGLAKRKLATNKRILVVGAHPDDEDSQLIAYLSLHDGADVAYLSLTRGEGGQNSIGGELGPALGLLRTGELLAARAVDGAELFFTRAYDFGFSKTPEETFKHWPRDSILADVVATVRRYRPDEIIAIFTGTPRDGHGQHQVSGMLAREAFDAAADPNRFPAQIRAGLRPHRTLRLIQATSYGQTTGTDSYATGAIDSLIGRSYWQLAAISRSRHRSQDMGMAQALGPRATATRVLESRVNPDSMSELKFKQAKEVETAHRARLLSAKVQLDAITNVERIVPGSTFNLEVSVWNGGVAPISIARVTPLLPNGWQAQRVDSSSANVAAGAIATIRFRVSVPNNAAISQPYFLTTPRAGDIYSWPDADYAGMPFDPAPVRAHVELSVDGVATEYDVTATRRVVDPRQGEIRRAPYVAPAFSLRVEPTTSVITLAGLAAGTKRGVDVTVELSSNGVSGTLDIKPVLPTGWSANPQKTTVSVTAADQSIAARFTISPPRNAVAGQYDVAFTAIDSSGRSYALHQRLVDYPHIMNRVLFEPAAVRITVLDARFARGLRVGYVVGIDAPIPSVLEQMGVSVDRLDENALANA